MEPFPGFQRRVELDEVDFDWVKNQGDLGVLIQAQKLLENEPYEELKKSIQEKIGYLEARLPKSAVDTITCDPELGESAPVSRGELASLMDDINKWTSSADAKDRLFKEAGRMEKKSDRVTSSQDGIKLEGSSDKVLSEVKTMKAASEKSKGDDSFRVGEYEKAVESYTRSIHLNPNNTTTYSNRAMSYLKLKKYPEAESDCCSILSLQPRDLKALYRRGLAKKEQGKYASAIDDFEVCLEISPDNVLMIRAIDDAQLLLKAASEGKQKKQNKKKNKKKGKN